MSNLDFSALHEKLSPSFTIAGEKFLYFGGTAYLGMPQDPNFIQLYLEGIQKFGLNNGTSRGNNVQLAIYNEVEAYAASRFGAEASLITSSGYLAASLTVRYCTKQGGQVRYAPNTHPALWTNGNPLNYADFRTWSAEIVAEINGSEVKKWVLLSNSLNNLYPEIYDFNFVEQLDTDKQITLIIDDSHGIGLINQGSSAWQKLPKCNHVEFIVVASMAKALGVDAGVVLGAQQSINHLKQSDEFYGASPPAAAGLYAFMKAEEIYRNAFNQLQQNITLFKQHLPHKDEWHDVADFPVFLCQQPGIAEKLLAQNVLISSFPYPDRNGANLNRIVLSAWHTGQEILELTEALN
jgi:8-amino-7-oxononanoate synthase